MKRRVVKFKSLHVALKELEPFVRHGRHLHVGVPFERFEGLRSRELLVNWLLCAVLNEDRESVPFTFTSDPNGGDGIIYDPSTSMGWPTEHVMVPVQKPYERRSVEDQIIDQVMLKQNKGGKQYAAGKTLIVFVEAGGGVWYPDKVALALPAVDFDGVWVCALQGVNDGEYVYGVAQIGGELTTWPTWRIQMSFPAGSPSTVMTAQLEGHVQHAPTWKVRISSRFDRWQVERLQ